MASCVMLKDWKGCPTYCAGMSLAHNMIQLNQLSVSLDISSKDSGKESRSDAGKLERSETQKMKMCERKEEGLQNAHLGQK